MMLVWSMKKPSSTRIASMPIITTFGVKPDPWINSTKPAVAPEKLSKLREGGRADDNEQQRSGNGERTEE